MPGAKRRRSRHLSVYAFLVTAGIGGLLLSVVDDRQTSAVSLELRDAIHQRLYRLQGALDRALLTLDTAAAFVRTRQPIGQFGSTEGERLLRQNPIVQTIAFAPQGIVTQVVPAAAAGSGALGWNLLEDRVLRPSLEDGGEDVRLAGPVLLPTREPGLVGYRPVALPGTATADGDPIWGYVVVTMPLGGLLRVVQADELLSRGYDYRLVVSDDRHGRPLFVASSTEILADPVMVQNSLPYGTVALAVASRKARHPTGPLIAETILVGVAGLVVALVTNRLVREPETLRDEIASRRRRLSQVRHHLRTVTLERQTAEQRLQHNTTHDALTGLRNRATFTEVVGSALEFHGGLRDFSVGVLFLDIDRMKQINDSLGATTGDLVLVEIAKRLEGVLSAEDVLARVGGDEFAILAAFQDPAGANVLADRLLRDLRKPFALNGVELVVGASIGIALSDPKRTGDLLAGAAAACNRAKQQGRGRWVVFEDAMRDRARSRIHLEAELRAAVARQEFLVFYEPVVSLKTGHLSGFEALVRWQHPERGMVSPGEFIPVAEETGLIVPIDRWVLVEAAGRMREWHDQFSTRSPLSISVNLSGAGLTEAGLVEHVKQTLKLTGLDPRTLKMELTESSVVEAADAGEAVLRALRECGVRLSLDDFGTGYSSFAYIQQFAFDTVKIDRSFIKAIDSDGRSREIVETITNLAHSLSMDVVAEGPESAAQISVLRDLGCDYAQGWYFSKPQDREKTTRFIEQDPVW